MANKKRGHVRRSPKAAPAPSHVSPRTAVHSADNAVAWRKGAREIGSALVATLGVAGLFISDMPLLSRLVAVVAITWAIVAIYTHGKWRALMITLMVVCLIGTVGMFWAAQPSYEEERVDAYLKETLDANIWVGRPPVPNRPSRDFMVENYDAFATDRWHGWNDLGATVEAVPSYSVITDSRAASGQAVIFAGKVNAFNDFGGGEYIVQLLPLSTEDEERWAQAPEIVDLLPDGNLRSQVFDSQGIRDPVAQRSLIYCRITPRPLFGMHVGDLWVVKGVTVAYGRTLLGSGEMADVGYVACSTVERYSA